MHRTLLGTGFGLMVLSLLVALFISAVDPLWAAQHLTLLAAFTWVRDAALVMGAALVAAGLVVVRLAQRHVPPASRKVSSSSGPEPASR